MINGSHTPDHDAGQINAANSILFLSYVSQPVNKKPDQILPQPWHGLLSGATKCSFFTLPGSTRQMQESEIIQSVLSGHTDDFTRLVKTHEAAVFRIVMGFVHHKEDAEDITQEVFVRAFQSLDSFAGRSSFSTWLYRIAIHTSLNELKKSKRKRIWSMALDLLLLPSGN